MSTERPILFSAPMVRALLDGRKTQTRRVINSVKGLGKITEFQRSDTSGYDWTFRNMRMLWNDLRHDDLILRCPYGHPGDVLWVREPARVTGYSSKDCTVGVHYLADGVTSTIAIPPRFSFGVMLGKLPKWIEKKQGIPNGCFKEAARLFLGITAVRVERLQEITEEDAAAEGFVWEHAGVNADFGDAIRRAWFRKLWDSLNAKRGFGWDVNPWVWVVEFKKKEVESC